MISPILKQRFTNSRFWLLGIAVCLMAIHLTMTLKTNNFNLLSSSALFWFCVSSSVWKRRDSLNFESGVISSFLGFIILAVVLLKSPAGGSDFLKLSPFLSALGLALIASDLSKLQQYFKELTCLFFLGVPFLILSGLIDISELTAKFATFLLWYSGFQVFCTGIHINLPHGGIEVYTACSGLESITYLLGIALLVLMTFPLPGVKKLFLPMVGVIVAFVVNGIRVAIMAVLAASSQQEAFEYWHTGDGSLIFSIVAVLLFGLFCLWMLPQPQVSQNR